jgi:nitrogen-specific signal transduction histidine kinase
LKGETTPGASIQTLPANAVEQGANDPSINAIIYTQVGGRVTVSASQSQARAVLQVADNGPGISAAERAKVVAVNVNLSHVPRFS